MESVKQIPDGSVESIIRELFEQGRAVTGVSVRQELRNRFGKPGGVSRIYRLIQTTLPQLHRVVLRSSTESEQQLLDEIAHLKKIVADANAAREHAERQESYWIMQVDAMRQRLAGNDLTHQSLGEAQSEILRLHRRLADSSAPHQGADTPKEFAET